MRVPALVVALASLAACGTTALPQAAPVRAPPASPRDPLALLVNVKHALDRQLLFDASAYDEVFAHDWFGKARTTFRLERRTFYPRSATLDYAADDPRRVRSLVYFVQDGFKPIDTIVARLHFQPGNGVTAHMVEAALGAQGANDPSAFMRPHEVIPRAWSPGGNARLVYTLGAIRCKAEFAPDASLDVIACDRDRTIATASAPAPAADP